MHPLRTLACALLLLAVSAAAQTGPAPAPASAQPADLAGLWKAKRRFGPDEQGTLILERSGSAYVADMAGRTLPVRVEQGELVFALPGDRGSFRGRFEAGRVIRGFWVRPPTPANSSRFASPVTLRPDGANRWIGTVEAMQDELTFFLLLQPRPDGTMRAVLSNPERDLGTQYGADRLARTGNALTLMGHRGTQPERALASGAYNPENDTVTLDFPSRGGAFVFSRDGDDSDFYPRGRSPGPYAWRRPPARADGWPTATLDEAGIDRAAIARLVETMTRAPMDSTDAPQIQALLVARHGRLVLEEYFHGFSRDTLHDTRSAAKSISAVTIGAAIRAGAPLSLSSPVYQVMSRYGAGAGDPRTRAMNLEHLLTMSSGYYCDDGNDDAPGNEETMTNQEEEPDWYRFTLRVPLATPPGENAVYCSASPNLALGMLGEATRETPLWSFDRLVARPLRIARYSWILDPMGRPYGGGSVRVLPRDFLKLGQLMLNRGSWEGRRILDPAFASAASAPQHHLASVYYGYLWWVEDYPYKGRVVRSYSARGAGGNLVIVVPELDLAVAIMAGNYSGRSQLAYTAMIVPRSILPAVRERGDDPRAPVEDRAFTSPYGRSANGSRVADPSVPTFGR